MARGAAGRGGGSHHKSKNLFVAPSAERSEGVTGAMARSLERDRVALRLGEAAQASPVDSDVIHVAA
jgi:hypothetical protein